MSEDKEEACEPQDGIYSKFSSECELCCNKYKEVCKIMSIFKGNTTLKQSDNFVNKTESQTFDEDLEW